MIPKAYITEWTQFAPWKSNEQIEQNLVICRALVGELYIKNIEEKMRDPEFIGDTVALIRPEEKWNAEEAYQLIKNIILIKL